MKIGIFDSGAGGLTVCKALRDLAPEKEYVYLADTEKVPYGDLSKEEIVSSALLALSFFSEKKVEAIVIACHTVSSLCLPLLQEKSPIPLIGVTRGSVLATEVFPPSSRLAVLGTTRTIESGVYEALLTPKFRVFPIACPSIVPFVEQGVFEGKELEAALAKDLISLRSQPLDGALLCCTHFPLVKGVIEKVLGGNLLCVDGAERVAKETLSLCSSEEKEGLGSLEIYLTKASPSFLTTAKGLLKESLECHVVNIRKFAMISNVRWRYGTEKAHFDDRR